MKKLLCFLLILSILAVSSCSKKNDNEIDSENTGSETLSVSDIKKIDKIENINYKNIKCDLLEVKLDTDAEKVYNYTWSYYPFLNSNDFYNDFSGALSNIFPEHTINEKAMVFNGARFRELQTEFNNKMEPIEKEINQKVTEMVSEGVIDSSQAIEYSKQLRKEYIEEHPEIQYKIPSVADYKDSIVSGEEDVKFLIYTEEEVETVNGERKIFFESQSPVGNGIFIMQKGLWVEEYFTKNGLEVPFLETIFPDSKLEKIGDYDISSEEKVKLLDKEVTVKEAVEAFEKDVNSYDFSDKINKDTEIVACAVSSYKLKDDIVVLKFLCTLKYKGIQRDYLPFNCSYFGSAGYPVYCFGYMVKSDEADVLYNYPRVMKAEEQEVFEEVISPEKALQTVSENLTQEVEFELKDVQLVYFSEDRSYELGREGFEKVKIKTTPEWKFSLYNKNDERYYYAFVHAGDGSGFHYFSLTFD